MRLIISFLILLSSFGAANTFPLTSDEFDDIAVGGAQLYVPQPKERITAIKNLQVIMDRRGFSPGVIDGLDTPRFRTQFAAFQKALSLDIALDDRTQIDELLEDTGGDPFVEYEITAKDLSYKFTPEIPTLYVQQASMRRIDFRSAEEMFAERFHMDEEFLRELNAGKDMRKAGTKIVVASFGKYLQKRVARIVADKQALQVRAYAQDGSIVATYPASIGSTNTPSPTGTHRVKNKAQNPAYTYDPNGSAQPGLSDGLVLLPPGPNGPVGNAWIGLSKRTYGIHGTPEPSEIGITASVGCVRLTNWDALELARITRRGVEVTFLE